MLVCVAQDITEQHNDHCESTKNREKITGDKSSDNKPYEHSLQKIHNQFVVLLFVTTPCHTAGMHSTESLSVSHHLNVSSDFESLS